jgi:PAS domain-containing protein
MTTLHEVSNHTGFPSMLSNNSQPIDLDSKSKKPRVKKACLHCQRLHVSCDNGRPCLRCATRGLDCQDYVPKRRGRKRINSPEEEGSSPPNTSHINEASSTGKDSNSSPILSLGNNSSPPSSEENIETHELVTKMLDLPSDLFSELLFSPFNLDGYQNSNLFANHPTSPSLTLNITPPSSTSSPLTPSSLMSTGSSPMTLPSTPQMPATSPSNMNNITTPDAAVPCHSAKYDENYKRFVEYIKTRVSPEERDSLEHSMWTVRHKVKVYIKESGRGTLSENLCLFAWRRDLNEQLTTLKELYDRVHIPTIVFERCGQLHYANDAYLQLTGLEVPLPSTEEYLFYKQISGSGVSNFMQNHHASMMDLTSNSYMFPCGVLTYPSAEYFNNKYAKEGNHVLGTMLIQVKRDPLGLPIVIVASFLPQFA